jgi:hypothetical protein
VTLGAAGRERLALAALGPALFALYLSNGTRFQGADTLGGPYTALSLIRDGDFFVDEMVRQVRASYWYGRGPRGHVSLYGFGPPLLAAPVYAALHHVAWNERWTENRLLLAGKLAAAAMTAAAAVLLAVTARRFASLAAALAVGLVFGVCSSAWTISSQALWRHSPAGLMVAAGLALLLWPAAASPSALRLGLSGLPLGLAVWCRENLVLVVAAAAVYLAVARGRAALLRFLVFAGLAGAALMALNFLHWGTPFSSGVYGLARSQTGGDPWGTPAWLGLYALLASPSRGLFVYSPVFVLSVWGLVAGARRGQPERATWIFLGAAALLAFAPLAKWHAWWQGACYGPRFLVDALPFLALLLVPVWRALAARPRSPGMVVAVAGAAVLALFSAVVQAAGAARYDGRAWDEPSAARSVDRHPERVLSWSDSQLFFYLKWPETRPDRIPWR